MSEVSKDTFVRLSVELPTGVEVKTRTTSKLPEVIKNAFGGLFSQGFDRIREEVTERQSMRSNGPIVLELEFPEALRAEVLAALEKLRTVGRV